MSFSNNFTLKYNLCFHLFFIYTEIKYIQTNKQTHTGVDLHDIDVNFVIFSHKFLNNFFHSNREKKFTGIKADFFIPFILLYVNFIYLNLTLEHL